MIVELIGRDVEMLVQDMHRTRGGGAQIKVLQEVPLFQAADMLNRFLARALAAEAELAALPKKSWWRRG